MVETIVNVVNFLSVRTKSRHVSMPREARNPMTTEISMHNTTAIKSNIFNHPKRHQTNYERA
ncbi:hypothetical protein FACS1894122_06550 [Alphaproteobacteria bacterium]|nr:hypothetical protein FACS1894122_06550 [Alphaproteobacteria bacterium]